MSCMSIFRFPQLSSAIVHTLRVFFRKMRMCSMAGGWFPSLHRNRGSSRALKSAAEVPGKGLWGGSGCQSKGNGRTVQRKRRGSQGFQVFFSSFLVGGHSFQFGFSFLAGGPQKATVFRDHTKGCKGRFIKGCKGHVHGNLPASRVDVKPGLPGIPCRVSKSAPSTMCFQMTTASVCGGF